jgi:hypothetical protein
MRLSALSEHNAEAKKQGGVAKIEGVWRKLEIQWRKVEICWQKKINSSPAVCGGQ